MIFIVLGSQKFQFNRLLKAVDSLELNEDMFAQTGYSDYKPRNYKYKDFLDRDEFEDMVNKADVVITHGGSGSIIEAVKKDKKVIAIPRLAKYREHVDDHQIELIEQFKRMNLIYACEDMDIEKALKIVKKTEYKSYHSNTAKILKNLEEFLENE